MSSNNHGVVEVSVHPLNLAVAFQILNNIKNGQLRSCLAMGFEENDLKTLIDPLCMGALVNSPVPWFKVVVDGVAVRRVLAHAKNTDEDELINRAISLGASSPMILELFGLPPKESAIRREILGVPHRRGRWPHVGPEDEAILWKHWVSLTKELGTNLGNPRSILDVAMLMAERERSLNLAIIWSAIQSWIAQDLV
ncbi:STY4526/YPO1902 family pathogenicity island replication protein [Pseudomonas sp. Y39-6]|uniref:STY4526/YPO1902 family pathogenicity island replication protein n=1 Tax=Pseudomonas sp. Y39-6 TaxID=2749807 RepID=UPI001F3B803D|nr:STY4526/YPO1902 family pathogenicity island replication protein [Pseudomonas sp. Y39-6]